MIVDEGRLTKDEGRLAGSIRQRSSAGARYKLGVIGYPVSHSLSPRMHNAALRALHMEGDYTAISVPPDQLAVCVSELAAQGYRGFNVTIPHKQTVMRLLTALSDSARAIGAVNTVVVEGGRLIGHNTDALGFMRGLEQSGFAPQGKSARATHARATHALVIGAGGAARAVVYALTQAGAHVTVWNRTRERAVQLADEFGMEVALHLAPPPRYGCFDLIVNTTSVGMTPYSEETPLHLIGRGFGARYVYDLVYNPRETVFLREARLIGAKAIGGLQMLVHQGAEAFRLWTGRDAPVDVMKRAIEAGG